MDSLRAIEQVEKMEIIHVHGTLGSLNSSADNYVPFGNIERSSLDRAASSIVIVHEAIGLDTFLDAKVLLGRQATTHIIGLGLDKTNFNRLDLQKVNPQNSIGSINGTFYGLTEHEVMQFQSKFKRIRLCRNGSHYDVAKNHRCLDYLRNNVLLS